MMLCDAEIQAFHDALRARGVLLVHFSGTPKGTGHDTFFPDDLLYGCAHDATTQLCCSTVGPSDFFDDVAGRGRNAVGSIGPVACEGAGSQIEKGDRPTTLAECHASIDERAMDGCNELNLVDYKVIGVLAVKPMTVDDGETCWDDVSGAADTPPELLAGGRTRDYRTVDVAELLRTFPGRRLFTFDDGMLREWCDDAWKFIRFEDVYPPALPTEPCDTAAGISPRKTS